VGLFNMILTYTYKGLIDEKPPKDVEEVKFADDVTVIRKDAFSKCNNLKNVVIPNFVTEIEECAFIGCSNLRSVVISRSVKLIGFQTFGYCYRLEQLILLNGVEEMHVYSFCNCHSLNSIFIPESVTMITYGAFASCLSLEYVIIMTSENQNIHDYAFNDCESLKRVFKISNQGLELKLSVIAKYPVGFETLKRLLDIDCKGVQFTNAERLYPFMAQACLSNLNPKYDADHLSSIYCLLRRDPSVCNSCK